MQKKAGAAEQKSPARWKGLKIMSETNSDRRSFEAASLAVELAGAIIKAKGGVWSVADAVALTKEIKQEMNVLLGEDSRALVPAVAVADSKTADWLVCLEDGKKLKLLKRYLKSHYNMTPEEYRRKWGLPADYPMAAPNYSKDRSRMARKIGLGKKRPALAA